MFTKLKRIFKFGWYAFSRSKGLSFQIVFIMGTAVFFILLFYLGRGAGQVLFDEIGRKVNISVYFKSDTAEQDILQIKSRLSLLSDKIKSIDYISKEMALDIFKADHQDDELYLKAIEEMQENPFLPHLDIYSDDPAYYKEIADFFDSPSLNDIVSRVSYEHLKNQQAIERLAEIIKALKSAAIAIVVLLGFLVVIITYNIIKLFFIILKDEIGTMKLVGASNWFVRCPFMIQTFFCALIAVTIVDICSAILLYFFSNRILYWLYWFSGLNFFNYFMDNLLIIFSIQFSFVFLLGIIAALLAMRKHLQV